MLQLHGIGDSLPLPSCSVVMRIMALLSMLKRILYGSITASLRDADRAFSGEATAQMRMSAVRRVCLKWETINYGETTNVV